MSKNNQVLLGEIIKQEMISLGYSKSISSFFEFYSALQILKHHELSYDEVDLGLCGNILDGGADSIYLFINGDLINNSQDVKDNYKKNVQIEFIIIQSKCEKSFGEDALMKLSRLCRNLFDFDVDRKSFEGRYNDHVLSSFELFKDVYFSLITRKPTLKISVYYASQGIDIHPNVSRQAEELKNDILGKLPTADVEVNFLGAEKLVKLYQERPNDVFKLKLSENPLSTSGQVFIALANLADYYKFISDEKGKLIKHIFESNVRDYQGKTNVNNEIQETLTSETGEEFWWLNNGVTILASEIVAPGGKELIIHNPEIVNGLQTSSEIHQFFTMNLERIYNEKRDILVRVIVPESEETRDKIIRATNSQTPIPKSSLRATDQIHRQIEDYLKPRGLYYDRRKNFYKNEGKKPKEIVSIAFMSQCLMSTLMQKPDFARARPSTLLEDDASYSKLFNINNDLNIYYLVIKWGRYIEDALKDAKNIELSQIADIKFYILFSVVSIMADSLYPTANNISKLKYEDLTIDIYKKSLALVFDGYQELGGTNKVAKGAGLIELLRNKLRVELHL